MKICIVGTGYVGLVTGACLVDFGNTVTCVDIDQKKIAQLSNGIIPFYEPGLGDLVKRGISTGRLKFSSDLREAVKSTRIVFICVGTPEGKDGNVNLAFVTSAAKEVAHELGRYKALVLKSTVPPGTNCSLRKLVAKETKGKGNFDVISNPEFLREGSAVYDFTHPDRIVIGCITPRARQLMSELYRPLYLLGAPIIFTNPESAELIKYTANAFLACKVSFINEIANLCEKTGANIDDVARGIGYDKRITPKFLHAGIGYGGSCFPKDTIGLVNLAQKHQSPVRIVESAVQVNASQRLVVFRKIEKALVSLKGKTVAIAGLAFKPNTDDVREAPALTIIKKLVENGVHVRAYDPVAMPATKKVFPQIEYSKDVYDAAKGADCLVLMTEWNEFRNLDFVALRRLLKRNVIVDCRNMYPAERLVRLGFRYFSVGR